MAKQPDDFTAFDPRKLSGWRPTPKGQRARWSSVFRPWESIPEYRATIQRTTSWDVLKECGGDQFFNWFQEDGDCVAWGAVKAFMSSMAWEIVRKREPEKFEYLFPCFTYGISRNAPEGGNGAWKRWRPDSSGNRAGSLGSWVAATLKYGVLRSNYPGVPKYSESVSRQWGEGNGYQQFMAEAVLRPFKSAAEITTGDQLVEAICNGYFVTIAGNREFSNRLTVRDGKGWYGRGQRVAHQTSLLAFDTSPEPCVYDSNQWPQHAQEQTDGPRGGGWRPLKYVDQELRSGQVECYAMSEFKGFPAEVQKPDFSVGA